MANTLGSVNGALIIQRALELAFLKYPGMRMISLGMRDLDGEVDEALLNQSVITRTRSVATVGNFGDAATNVTTVDVPVVLSAAKQILHTFSTTDYNSTNRNLIEEQAEPIAVAISQWIVGQAGALWTIANGYRHTVVANAWGYVNTDLVMKASLDTNGVPDMARFFAYNSAVEVARLADPLIVAALNNPSNGDAIRLGRLPQVAGLAQAPFYGIPGNGINLVGAAGTPDATVYAARAPKNPEDVFPGPKFPGTTGFVEDPNSGFRLLVQQWIGTDNSLNNRFGWLEGYAKGNTNNLTLLTTA